MINFKFFQKLKTTQSLNHYLGFDMDEALIKVLIYKQLNNQQIINWDLPLSNINIPINNCSIRILTWRNYTNAITEMIEIDYMVIEVNTTPMNFTTRMMTSELLRRIEQYSV